MFAVTTVFFETPSMKQLFIFVSFSCLYKFVLRRSVDLEYVPCLLKNKSKDCYFPFYINFSKNRIPSLVRYISVFSITFIFFLIYCWWQQSFFKKKIFQKFFATKNFLCKFFSQQFFCCIKNFISCYVYVSKRSVNRTYLKMKNSKIIFLLFLFLKIK